MKTIALFQSNEDVEFRKFAGGECHVRFAQELKGTEQIRLNTRMNTSDDFMTLCLAVDALRRMQIGYIEVFIPYIPYARQDRVMVPGEPLSIRVFAQLLNSLNLDKVIVFDPHSDVSAALIDRCEIMSNFGMVRHLIEEFELKNFTLVSPDLGAYKKVDKLGQYLGYRGEIATGIKIRDLVTGEIVRSDVNVDSLEGKACLVVDDICDGGRTFIELAGTLNSKGAGKLYLVVSHGIFSHNALERLQEAGYTLVYSSNSIADLPQDTFYKAFNLF